MVGGSMTIHPEEICNTYLSGKLLKNGESLYGESKFYAKRNASPAQSELIILGQSQPMPKNQWMRVLEVENT